MTILALSSHRGRAGKDTLLEHLEQRLDKVAHRVAFADELKEELAGVLKVPVDDLHNPELKDAELPLLRCAAIPPGPYKDWLKTLLSWDNRFLPRTLRWHLQMYGTEYIRKHLKQPSRWLNLGLERIKGILNKDPEALIVVTDMRMANEYAAMGTIGAQRVRINRGWSIPEVDNTPPHESDTALDNMAFEATITNAWGKPEDMVDQLITQGIIER